MTEVSREYDMLKRRDFKPYSRGHQLMYLAPLLLMERVSTHSANAATARYRIVEAGFGIGFGLDKMIEAGVIAHYLGFEPDRPSFDYVRERHGGRHDIVLHNAPFVMGAKPAEPFDVGFCIEVIEHVALDSQPAFLGDLRRAIRQGGTLWFSTPDQRRNSHGVRRAEEWGRMLRAAGFLDVIHHADQWTDLYVCQ